MDIISIINQKGGVGKSTTAHAIGTGLQLRGFKVFNATVDYSELLDEIISN